MAFLLDVNLLVALSRREHALHDAATRRSPARSSSASRAGVVGHRQVTDVHLAALAAHHELRLATLDRAVVDALHPDDRGVVEVVPAG